MKHKQILLIFAFLFLVGSILACSSGGGGDGGGASREPMPGLAGKWRDVYEDNVHTIVWTGTTYRVTSVGDEGRLTILSQEWNGSTFTFVYRVPGGSDVTIECVQVRGDELDVNWWSTNGNSGTDVFVREP
ncbi:MAG: hypothetical protein N2049_05615 [Anaerolineales bacterium]|nr:hypothetical protein [Anaerolineales bacterium]